MRVAACATAVALVVAASAAGAQAASPRMSPADRAAISALVDRFVKDAVRREDLAAAWELAGPDLRAGTTRAAWVRGTGVTVPYFPVRGTDFRSAWTGRLVGSGHAQLALIMHPRPGTRGFEQTAASIDVRKRQGRWIVDIFYSAAVFHRDGSVSGPSDFMASNSERTVLLIPERNGAHWLMIAVAFVLASLVLVPLGYWSRVKWLDRRARAEYMQAHYSHR